MLYPKCTYNDGVLLMDGEPAPFTATIEDIAASVQIEVGELLRLLCSFSNAERETAWLIVNEYSEEDIETEVETETEIAIRLPLWQYVLAYGVAGCFLVPVLILIFLIWYLVFCIFS